jgi:group II intron reverse transcriptase/maturase
LIEGLNLNQVKVNECYPMKGRMQKISHDNSQGKDRSETESKLGVQTYIGITENNFTTIDGNDYDLLELILAPTNLNAAYKQVKSNKGSGGVDGMGVDEIVDYLIHHKEALLTSIANGKYKPNPVRRVEIPKEGGKKRQLGIPTVVDRVIQQAIAQILSPIYEPLFSNSSYGFRPKRSAHDALKQCQEYISNGYKYSVDMDLEKYFDTVSHSKLIEVLSRTIKDGRVISLIHRYMNAGVIEKGKFVETKIGVPQGGPLSPLLSNIMLNELDKELERRGHKFVRYADDCMILCKSKRAAQRTLDHIIPFIEGKLYLKVNKEKTIVAHVKDIKFLGYSFYIYSGIGVLRVHPKSITKMKENIKILTCRSNGWGTERRNLALRQYITGWVNYFKLANMKSLLTDVDGWYRRRLRMVIWKQWKRIKTRFQNLMKLGISQFQSMMFSNTRKGYWHTAKSPILSTSITNESLHKAGYTFFSTYYFSVRG